MNLRHLTFAAIPAALLALTSCGGTTLSISPAAATTTTSGPNSPSAAAVAAAPACDTSAWTGAISPQGRPDNFDAGDAGAVYIWHDADGWHVRATDQRPTDHHYTGTIRLAPTNESFVDIKPVRDEKDDHVYVDGNDILHYDFHTYASIDGVDFRVTCADPRSGSRERERLGFHTEFDGHPISDRVRIGDTKQSPKSADFGFVRSI
jgi:hypothetical protein